MGKEKNVCRQAIQRYTEKHMPFVCFLFAAIIVYTGIFSGCGFQHSSTDTIPEENAPATNTNDSSKADGLKTKFVKVVLVEKDHIILRDTKGDQYWVDSKYNQGFDVGDLLCLVYQDGAKDEDGYWKVEPIQLYINDNRVDIPAY